MRRKFTLQQAEAHVPLVRAILRDVTAAYSALSHNRRRHELLYDCRTSSRYEVRREFYQAEQDVQRAEQEFDRLRRELIDLGVALLDPARGIAGFPFRLTGAETRARQRRAYFLLKLSDSNGLGVWKRAGEVGEQPIPAGWRNKKKRLSASGSDPSVASATGE